MPKPALVIHGGAGSISRTSVPPGSDAYKSYTTSLRSILSTIYPLLLSGTSALDAATRAVQIFENDPQFNCGKGAVFNRAGKNELEASVMVSRGAQKKGVGVQMLKTVKNPILFAKELLIRGAEEGVPHNCLSGEEAERLAEEWGCEIVDESYFWTEKRWKEHMRGLETEKLTRSAAIDEEDEYLPQG
jgi:L-asparaginase